MGYGAGMWRVMVVLVTAVALIAAPSASAKKVAKPRFVRNVATGETHPVVW